TLRHFRDEQGLSFAERGVAQLRLPRRFRKLLSLLAITGFLHFWLFVSYVLPYQLMSLRANSFPRLPSYMLAGRCEEEAAFSCSTELPATPEKSNASGRERPLLRNWTSP
ncbi:MAG TPA: hypothetical protein VKA30_03590, partial [Actinomycetota bacterium]|nr:hypothetical protein [Actinomycetota bacterium]